MSSDHASLTALRQGLAGRPVALAGLGLIGGSIGLDLAARGIDSVGLVHREATAERARERGLAGTISTNPAVLHDAGIVLLCLPLDCLMAPPPELLAALPRDAVVSDVGSVKGPVLVTWREHHRRFIGGHPMAGTTDAGVEAGRPDLFQNRPWVLTTDSGAEQGGNLQRHPATQQEGDLQLLEALVTSLGARVVRCTAAAHDRAVALISHLPVLVGAALLHTVAAEPDPSIRALAQRLASSGFGDTTRVGGGNPELGTLMTATNVNAVTGALGNYRKSLEWFESILQQCNTAAIGNSDWSQLYNELKRLQAFRMGMWKQKEQKSVA